MPDARPPLLHGRRAVILGGGLAGIAAAIRLADRGAKVTLVETRKRLGGRATSFVDPTTGQVLDNCQHVLMGCCTNLLDLYKGLGVQDAIEWHRRLHFMNLGSGGTDKAVRGLVSEDGHQSTDTDKLRGLRLSVPPQPLSASPDHTSLPIDILEADDLPAPFHMTRALMSFAQLTLLEKLAISRGMLAIMRVHKDERHTLHNTSFAQWLEDHGQPQGAIEKFWAPVVVSALNEEPGHCAADYAIHVYQDGFLSSADAYVMGLSRVPLVRLYDAAEAVLAKAGGTVMLGASVEKLHAHNDRVTALELADGSVIEGDAFISALPFDRLAKVCTPDMYKNDLRLRRLDRFTTSPIIGIHLWFDRPVMDLPHLVLTQSPLQWIFNKGLEAPAPSPSEGEGGGEGEEPPVHPRASHSNPRLAHGAPHREHAAPDPHPNPLPKRERGWSQHLHGVISAAYDLVDQPAESIIQIVLAEVRKALPLARNATVMHARVIKEKRATFSPRPGVDALRPSASGAIANLYLAGDWCKTGWPATMEGAVRSGYLAAAALLRDAGAGDIQSLVPDLPAEQMYRLIGG